jgi:hypothetical protein
MDYIIKAVVLLCIGAFAMQNTIFADTLPPVIVQATNPTSQNFNIFMYNNDSKEWDKIGILESGQKLAINVEPYVSQVSDFRSVHQLLMGEGPLFEVGIKFVSTDKTFAITITKSHETIIAEYATTKYNMGNIIKHKGNTVKRIYNPTETGRINIDTNLETVSINPMSQTLQEERKQLESQRLMGRPQDIMPEKSLQLKRK